MAKFGQGRTARENGGRLSDDMLWFDRPISESKGHRIYGTAGDDDLKGTKGSDRFHVEQNNLGDGGDDILDGGKGNDFFFFGITYTDSDIVSGGDGNDRVIIEGSSEDQFVFGPDNLDSIEKVKLYDRVFGEQFYNVKVLDGLSDITIEARVQVHNPMTIDASLLSTGNVKLGGGVNIDTLIGGSGDDTIYGGFSADKMTGGEGADTFVYKSMFDSQYGRSDTIDTIKDFERGDVISLRFSDSDTIYHIGETEAHQGDVLVSYDPQHNRTLVDIFVDADDVVDSSIFLSGDISTLGIVGDNNIVLI